MKRVILGIGLVFVLYGCAETPQGIQEDIDRLSTQRKSVQTELVRVTKRCNKIKGEILSITDRHKELLIIDSGKEPVYLLNLKLYQSHFTLDIGTMMKDSMNEVEFQLPVSKTVYDSMNVGDKLLQKFRDGSLLMNGSIGDWNIDVTGKEIK